MKNIFLISLFISAMTICGVSALQIQDTYSVQASTDTATLGTPNINAKNIRVKQIMITNAGTAQTVTIYKNAISTTTATSVMKIDVPASTPVYFPTTIANDDQNFEVPYFAVRTSTSTNSANVTVLYKKD